MFELLAKQFEKPEGIFGKLAGKIMYFENRKINKWTIRKLNIKRRDSRGGIRARIQHPLYYGQLPACRSGWSRCLRRYENCGV